MTEQKNITQRLTVNVASFSNAFKRFYGVSPKQYMENANAADN